MEIMNNKREYGIDLLKIFSMYMVVLIHILGQGGVLAGSIGNKYHVYSIIQVASYCAVNCFAMVSGYLLFGKKQNIPE